MLINIKKTMTILSTLLLGIMCSFCSDTIDVYAGQYGEEDGTSEPETPEVTGNIVKLLVLVCQINRSSDRQCQRSRR